MLYILLNTYKLSQTIELTDFIKHIITFDNIYKRYLIILISHDNLLKTKTYVEIETNGTLHPSQKLATLISQFNVSPKLKNSGMPVSKRRIQLSYLCQETPFLSLF